MNIETQEASLSLMNEKRNFGWKQDGSRTVRRGRSGHRTIYTLKRDRDRRNYAEIDRLEGEYFNLKRTQKTYDPMEASHVLIAFAVFIVPGIIYVTFKLKQKKRIREHNAAIQKKMDAIVAKVRPLL